MTKIIGGIVAYEDGVKTVGGDQFSPTRKVRVELNFSLDDGEGDESIAKVLDKASAFVANKLKGANVAPKPAAASSPAPAPATPPATGGKTKADLEAEARAKATPAAEKPPRAPRKAAAEKPADAAPAPAADPASMDDFTVQPAKPAADPASMDDLTTAAPKEISDKDLNDAVQKKNGILKNPVKIREVIGQFNPDPSKQFTLAQIPQAQRQEFLNRLEALK